MPMLYKHKTKSIARCKQLESQDIILIQGKDIFINYWFECFNSNVECPKNITSISLELTFTLVRAYFYKQSHWMTEMSLVFVKSIKAA